MGEHMLDSWVMKYGFMKKFFENHVQPHAMLNALEQCATETSAEIEQW